MPGIARKGDPHSCGAVAVTYSPNVFCDGLNVHREGDIDVHGPCVAVQVAHSPTTFANGIPVARCGDNHSGDGCHPPNPHSGCSPTTFADG